MSSMTRQKHFLKKKKHTYLHFAKRTYRTRTQNHKKMCGLSRPRYNTKRYVWCKKLKLNTQRTKEWWWQHKKRKLYRDWYLVSGIFGMVQRSDLNPSENLWNVMKMVVKGQIL